MSHEEARRPASEHVRAGAPTRVMGFLVAEKECLAYDRYVAERMAEHEARVRQRERGEKLQRAFREAGRILRERLAEERRLKREARNKPCGARTRAGHPCKRKGLGKGGRCSNHGGMSTGPKTEAGRLRIVEFQKQRWEKRRLCTAT